MTYRQAVRKDVACTLKQQSSPFIIIILLSLAGFALMAYNVSVNEGLYFDKIIIHIVQGWEEPGLTAIMKFFTTIGSTKVMIVFALFIMFFLYKVLHHRSELLLFIIVIIGSPLLNEFLKQVFQRVRPEMHRLIDIGGYSFPSGHAMNAFTFYGILTFLLWRHISGKKGRRTLILGSSLLICMIGLSRVYLGVHYPSDIIGGYLGSCCWLLLSIWVFQFIKEKHTRRQMLWHE